MGGVAPAVFPIRPAAIRSTGFGSFANSPRLLGGTQTCETDGFRNPFLSWTAARVCPEKPQGQRDRWAMKENTEHHTSRVVFIIASLSALSRVFLWIALGPVMSAKGSGSVGLAVRSSASKRRNKFASPPESFGRMGRRIGTRKSGPTPPPPPSP